MNERPVMLPAARGLAGIVTSPREGRGDGGVAAIFLDTGLTYRVGANRLTVGMARRLAAAGMGALRFDFSGVGDSPPRTDGAPFSESAPEEVRLAMDWMAGNTSACRFVLIGLCSGARVAFRTAVADERVVGIGLLNLRNLEDEEYSDLRAVAQSYQTVRELWRPRRWARALTGRTDYGTVLRKLAAALKRILLRRAAVEGASRVAVDLSAILDRGTRVHLVFSQEEFGRRYLPLALGRDHDRIMAHPGITEQLVPDADHCFTWMSAQDAVLGGVAEWAGCVADEVEIGSQERPPSPSA